MENKNTTRNQDFKTEIICDVKRSETEIYRISRKEYKGRHFMDLRIFFRSKNDRDRLVPTHKGISIAEEIRQEVIVGLINARKASAVTKPEGEKVHSVTICEIPVSETETFRISKGCGSKNAFVDIRCFFKKGNGCFPSKRKGVSITESCLDDVITGLMRTEPACVS